MTSVKTRSLTTVKTLPAPRNGWYAAAWDREVTRTPASVRVAGQPLVFYRTEDGRPVALADACWHRLAPLSMGTLVGSEEIRCPYHGIVYDSAGRCTAMPAQEVLNPSATVPSYPVVERHRFVWVWLGDPYSADPSAIPDMRQMDDPGWAGDGQAILDARRLRAALVEHRDPRDALADYEGERRPKTTAVVLTNRVDPPDAILREVWRRTGDRPFDTIESVISASELTAISQRYKDIAGLRMPASPKQAQA